MKENGQKKQDKSLLNDPDQLLSLQIVKETCQGLKKYQNLSQELKNIPINEQENIRQIEKVQQNKYYQNYNYQQSALPLYRQYRQQDEQKQMSSLLSPQKANGKLLQQRMKSLDFFQRNQRPYAYDEQEKSHIDCYDYLSPRKIVKYPQQERQLFKQYQDIIYEYPNFKQLLFYKLIEHIVKTDEIRKHLERLKKKKVFDKLEQKKIEKERLKAELGSAYESSDDDSLNDFEDLGLQKEELEQILAERKDRKKDSDDEEEQIASPSQQLGARALSKLEEKLDQIQELDENEQQGEDQDEEKEKEDVIRQLRQQREQDAFNPLKFLAQQLKDLNEQKKQKQKEQQQK
ncbi:hypothetical protein PPERSA_10569 [Pseudocohnilembus persalinus]|uniref:Uncharacterized protein n=1 Tax=Pseudocohnilembus persalinus TaxID=266149 RepID=A0A0V0Q9B0_PSEPJ|nr:hypothetical protein PPERSA_10569 [Pseudocohnilembus persalinus]|eukprot:KRW98798.1 hypothetical protein PPERSA_10569 [Pseudocohnilembus persalinus]